MSVKSFIQTIWSADILDDLERKCVLVQHCTTEYEGDCKYAQTVKILSVGDPTIGIYTGEEIEYEEMNDSEQLLVIDIRNYFAFLVDDVDKAQSVPGQREAFRKKAVNGLAKKRDDLIGKLVAGKAQSSADEKAKNTTYKEGATNIITASGKTQTAVKGAIDDAIVKLRENDFEGGGYIEITPAVYMIFKNNLIELNTNNPELIQRGQVGKYDTYDVYMTNGIYKDETHAHCIVRSKEAIAFAGQINNVEAGRSEKYFKDYIRGLDVHGVKIIKQNELVDVKIPV